MTDIWMTGTEYAAAHDLLDLNATHEHHELHKQALDKEIANRELADEALDN